MLTREQLSILARADVTEEPPSLDDLRKVPGFHFCPDWDYLPICDDSPEADCCCCTETP
jgi:hypothetical protein